MRPMYECYDNIIGLSQTECSCSETGRPEDFNESQSGLFLDELAPINGMLNSVDCGKTMWDVLTAARADAIKQFVVDTNALLGKRFNLRRQPVKSAVLGQIKAKTVYSNEKNYAVQRWVCCPVRGGVATLKSIGGVFLGTQNIDVEIYNSLGEQVGGPYTLTANNGKHSAVPVNLELPLRSKYVDNLEYYFTFVFDPLSMPKDTRLECGCGNWSPTFNTSAPYFDEPAKKSAPWTTYVMVGGMEVNSLSELWGDDDLPTSLPLNMMGLTIEADFGCKVQEVLCENSLDFNTNPLALSMAMAIRFLTASKVADALLRSSLLNRPNMLSRDEWQDDAILWENKYNNHTAYIVSEAQSNSNDCFVCKDIVEMTRAGLFG